MNRSVRRSLAAGLAVATFAAACTGGESAATGPDTPDDGAATAPEGAASSAPVAETEAPARGAADPEAAAVAARVEEYLGGDDAWSEARFLAFGFAGAREHAWDRATGRHRVAGQTPEGEDYVVVHDLDSREGRVWIDGEEVSGERAAELLESAYGAWVNDTYWLLMPYKLRDPGVTLSHDGRREVDGQSYEVLHLSFADVGLTPGDRYWAYVDPATGRMDYWAFLLESMEPEAEPMLWRWSDWQAYDGIRLASGREQVGGDRSLELAPITVSAEVPEGAFAAP